jgi:membrane protein YdbS with pleckstrin-like domain
MRIVSIIVVIWLIIGAVAAGQRHYFNSSDPHCSRVGNIVLTIAAGPLNYVGVNPKLNCHVPKPSK